MPCASPSCRGGLLLAVLLPLLPLLPARGAPTREAKSPRTARPAALEPVAPAPEPAPRAALELPPPPRRAEREERGERAEPKGGLRPERLGVGLDLFGEGSRMQGEQRIQDYAQDESFDYAAGGLSATVWLLAHPWERVRVGPGLRLFGTYGQAGGGRTYRFGLLNELFLLGEYAHPAFERVELVLGGRAGLALLVPGDELAEEIRRLQANGAGVWSVPRVGWLLGLNVGVRRRMTDTLALRLDLLGQLEHLYLFATDQRVQVADGDLRFRKFWGNDVRRLGLTLGVELSF